MKKIEATWDFRSFVVGISNHTQESFYWSWTVYLGPLFVQINILKPRPLRRRISDTNARRLRYLTD